MQKLSTLTPTPKGFTLIELLVVIAVLGVLAAGVLVAVNPAEQLAKGRDAGRISGVAQLGRVMEGYSTGVLDGRYQLAALPTTWQTAYLVASGEIKNRVLLPSIGGGNDCTYAGGNEGNICYTPMGSEIPPGSGRVSDATIWATLESNSSKKRAGCAAPKPVVIVTWIASQGKTGLDCVSDPTQYPAVTDVLK